MLKRIISYIFLLILSSVSHSEAQVNSTQAIKYTQFLNREDLFATTHGFVENVGQYGDYYAQHPEMGKILFAYEGFEMPVLFTEKGLIYLHRKIEKPKRSREEEEKLERKNRRKEALIQEFKAKDKAICMLWENANQTADILTEDKSESYHTYGLLQSKAHSFKKITFKNLYLGIDLVFSIDTKKESGFEYSFVVNAGADANLIQLRFSGDVKSIKNKADGQLCISSNYGKTYHTQPLSYYTENTTNVSTGDEIKTQFNVEHNSLNFSFPNGYNKNKTIVIDPFITATGNLIGTNAGKAKDVDFDYAGNVYVAGGGDGNVHKLAKYNSAGVLQWTFTGTLAVPAWNFGPYYGGWVVEKSTGKVYLGHGFNPSIGYQVIRITTDGLYDNYISTGNPSANEDWKMYWSCNNGSPQILVAGGGTSGNLNLGILAPPSPIISGINITGLAGIAQDMADLAYDPANFDIYSIYASLGGTPFVNNRIYKNTAPYSAASISWNALSGYTSLSEANNRPYLAQVGAAFSDNSANILALNSSYLFYYDGKNLKAFSKATGAAVGTALTLAANTVMLQGGIEADECNNVFIGSINGVIKVYQFNGSTFNDAAAPDITVTGFTTKSVYDLVINEGQKLLYACGDGFVASFDIASYGCGSSVYTLSVASDCANHSATASLSPAPPANSTITYVIYDGLTQLASNTTGIFNGLTPNVNYTIHAFVNQACSGTESVTNFTLIGPGLTVTPTNTNCGLNAGAIVAAGLGGVPPLTYSIDGVTFQASGNFNGLAAGIYTVTLQDAIGCASTSSVNIINANGPTVGLTKTDASCGATTGTISATGAGGSAPYQFALNNGAFQTANTFTSLPAGSYQVTVKDATNCSNSSTITINSIGNTIVTSTNLPATCGNNNGSISANVSGGTPPYTYSLDGITFQSNNVFAGLAPGSYTLTAKDADNCTNAIPAPVGNLAGPIIAATASPSTCSGLTGLINVTASGTAPFQYSINGGLSYQTTGTFTGLSAGNYAILVKDANNCTAITSVIVNLSVPQVTDSTTASSCSVNDGTITAIGTGGILPYQYSLDGINFQASNVFTALGAGSYTLTIIDLSGCKNSISPVIVGNAASMTISAIATKTACSSATGTITATAGGGQAPLQYSVDSLTYQSSPIFTSLAAGNYSVSVKDANACIASVTTSITKISAPTVSAVTTSTSCNSNTGSITATGANGVLPYTYSINGINFFSNSIFTALSPGPYVVTIKDANLCTSTANVLISNVGSGSGPTVTATTISAECGQANGRINGNGSGGNNPKQYSIDGINWQGSTNFSNLLPGTYTLYVRDASGCINFTTAIVANFAGPQVSATTTPASCGVSNGTITATGFAGTPNYRYSIDGGINFQTSSNFTGLAAGFYTVTVRDAANVCRNSIVVYIGNSNGPSVAFTKTDATCGTNNGSITAGGAGGTAPLSFSIDGVNYQSSNQFIGLTPGQYALSVRDANGCANLTTVTIGAFAAPQLSLSAQPETCGMSNASITVTGNSGTLPYQYSSDGVNYQSSNILSGLSAGPYSITIQDGNNCVTSASVTISAIDGPQLVANSSPSTCHNNNGSMILTASGGTGPYSYSLDGTNYQNSFLFTGLATGSGTAFIIDANNCIAQQAYTVGGGNAPHITVVDSSSICGQNIKITTTGGVGPFQYNVNNTAYQSSPVFACQLPGVYMVRVVDANGCMDSVIFLLDASLPIELISFTGETHKNYNHLFWSTASENDNAYFTIERSKDAANFEIVGFVPGAGNSFNVLNYSLKDENPYPGVNYYRLKQTCFDADFHYSGIIALNSDLDGKISYFYNELDNVLVINKINTAPVESIELMDATGRLIYSSQMQNNHHQINTAEFAKGFYFLHLKQMEQDFKYKIVLY